MTKQQLEWMLRRLGDVQKEVDVHILRAPTGARRNKFTDVNIHLLSAIMALSEVPSATVDPQK